MTNYLLTLLAILAASGVLAIKLTPRPSRVITAGLLMAAMDNPKIHDKVMRMHHSQNGRMTIY